jgi:hypothetical protein
MGSAGVLNWVGTGVDVGARRAIVNADAAPPNDWVKHAKVHDEGDVFQMLPNECRAIDIDSLCRLERPERPVATTPPGSRMLRRPEPP